MSTAENSSPSLQPTRAGIEMTNLPGSLEVAANLLFRQRCHYRKHFYCHALAYLLGFKRLKVKHSLGCYQEVDQKLRLMILNTSGISSACEHRYLHEWRYAIDKTGFYVPPLVIKAVQERADQHIREDLISMAGLGDRIGYSALPEELKFLEETAKSIIASGLLDTPR